MRCEICCRSQTEVCLDMAGQEHEYCSVCSSEIQDTLESYDADEEDWVWVDPPEDTEEDQEEIEND